MSTQQSTCFCCWDDLSYGLNTLGPLCLWQCFSYECSPEPRVLLLLDDRKGVGLGSGGAGGRINDDVRSPFGPISWRKSSQQFPRHARCRWPCENLFCSFWKAHGGMPGSIRYHQQPSKTHRRHPPLVFCSCQMLNVGQVSHSDGNQCYPTSKKFFNFFFYVFSNFFIFFRTLAFSPIS